MPRPQGMKRVMATTMATLIEHGMKKILILNGPNLNMLGRREPQVYGSSTLSDIEAMCGQAGKRLGLDIDFRQSNHEGVLVDWIQEALDRVHGIIINAGAYTHTSLALHDALKLHTAPIVEVHISDPKKREAFRHFSYIEPLARKTIAGQGAQGYVMALECLADMA